MVKKINWDDVREMLKELSCDSFICHTTDEDWGSSVLFMKRDGKAFARTYWFHNQNDTIFLDQLSVSEDSRIKGYGNLILNIHIVVSERFKLKSLLFVKKNSWMRKWYERKGYTFDCNKDKNHVWLKRVPKNN